MIRFHRFEASSLSIGSYEDMKTVSSRSLDAVGGGAKPAGG